MTDLFTWLDGDRDGKTYDPVRDGKRLNRQARLVWDVLRDGHWHTLAEISAKTDQPEASVSARIRDLRKERFGKHQIVREHMRDGLWRYRLVVVPGPEMS